MIDGLGRGAPPRMPIAPSETPVRTAGAPPVSVSAPQADGASGGDGVVRTLAAAPPVEMAKIEALRRAIAAGTYRPDPDAIAARMIALERGSA